MADTYGPFDGSAWSQAQWFRHMTPAIPSGVHDTPGTSTSTGGLAFSSSALNISIGTGRANVGGAGFERTGTPPQQAVTANANTTQSRRDRVVLRRDLGPGTVTVTRIQGTPAATPIAPDITRTDTVYDLTLFSFLVPPNSGTNITGVIDERVWLAAVTEQAGTVTTTFSNQDQKTGSVTFPTAFLSAPVITISPEVEAGSSVDLTATLTDAPTATGFSWRMRDRAAANVTVVAKLHWLAKMR